MNNTCDNCIFSIFATGKDRAVLICQQKTRHVGRWNLRGLKQNCQNFYPSTAYRLRVEALSVSAGSAQPPSPRRIPLTRGQFAIVDSEDYPQLSKFIWFAESAHNTYYAVRKQNGKSIKRHRHITNAPPDLVVDHIDHNGLNNQKTNLRLCTFAQNAKNIKSAAKKTSIYKGVHWHKNQKKWAAQITCDKKAHHLGYFKNQIQAAKAYDNAAKKLHKEFASLNFPKAKFLTS